MQSLSHPGCLELVEIRRTDCRVALITMLMKDTLENGMRREFAKCPLPDWETTKSVCVIGIAFAMEYVHLSNWLHRDLKPRNVLLNQNFEPVLTDFGLAEHISELDYCAMLAGTPLYMAPEVFMDEPELLGLPADVYSYAILLYQLFTQDFELDDGKGPFKNTVNLMRRIIQNARYVYVAGMPSAYWQLIQRSWQTNPSARPTFSDIIAAITSDLPAYLFPGANMAKVASYICRMQANRPKHHTK
jgi:serine/threonine protein kinase